MPRPMSDIRRRTLLAILSQLPSLATVQEVLNRQGDQKTVKHPESASAESDESVGSPITLDVETAYDSDIGRSIARVGPGDLSTLSVDAGDVVLLGDSGVPARVWRTDRDDWGSDTVRIDSALRQSIPVQQGDSINVYPSTPAPAERVTCVFPSGQDIDLTPEAEPLIKSILINRPLSSKMLVPLPMSDGHPFTTVATSFLPVYVSAIGSGEVGMVTKDTTVRLISLDEVHSDRDEVDDICSDRGDAQERHGLTHCEVTPEAKLASRLLCKTPITK